MQFSEEFDCIYFSTSSSVVRKTSTEIAAFLRFCFSLAVLKYSLTFMAAKSFTYSSVKISK